jgi:hypothetical protein
MSERKQLKQFIRFLENEKAKEAKHVPWDLIDQRELHARITAQAVVTPEELRSIFFEMGLRDPQVGHCAAFIMNATALSNCKSILASGQPFTMDEVFDRIFPEGGGRQ